MDPQEINTGGYNILSALEFVIMFFRENIFKILM